MSFEEHDLEQEMINQAAEQMQVSIDSHIIACTFIQAGWTEIVVDPWVHGSNSAITAWCDNTLEKNYIQDGNRWILESKKDAVMFALKWS